MNPVLKDVELVVERLKRIPIVTKVVLGSISKTPHDHRPGELKWIKREGNGTAQSATIRAFSSQGMQNLHVYATDIDALQTQLVVAPKPRAKETPLPADTRIERVGRQQPIYPSDPSPMRSAAPVLDSEVRGKLVKISPDIAINWLERNSRNRPLRQGDVQKYANDMRAGRWMPGGVVIKFATDGTIINGQHTLWGIIESGQTIEAYVLTGLDPNVVMVEDDHARRRLMDVVRINHPGSTVGLQHTAVATMLRYSQGWHRGENGRDVSITRQQEMAYLDEHHECIDFAIKAVTGRGNKRGIAVSAVIAPIARAWHTQDHEKLQRFGTVIATGMVEDKSENVAILLRNYLLSREVNSTILSKQDVYRRTERALQAFLNGEHLTLLRPVLEELYLLPGERKKRRGTHG